MVAIAFFFSVGVNGSVHNLMKILKQRYLNLLSLFSLNNLMSLVLSVLVTGLLTVQAEEATTRAEDWVKRKFVTVIARSLLAQKE